MKLSVEILRRSSNFHAGQLPPLGIRALTPNISCTSSETPETSSGSLIGTLLHRQARLDHWTTCIVPFPTVMSFFPQGFAAQSFLMAMAGRDNPILEHWDLRNHGLFLDLRVTMANSLIRPDATLFERVPPSISKKGTAACQQALHCSISCVMPNSSQTLRIRLHLLPQFCHAKSALQSLASHNPPLLPHNILAPACFPVHRENCFAMRKSHGVNCIRIRYFSHIFQPDTSDFHAEVAYLHSE